MNEAQGEAGEMTRVGDWRPDTTCLGIEAQTKCMGQVNDKLDCMLHNQPTVDANAIVDAFLGTLDGCREQGDGM